MNFTRELKYGMSGEDVFYIKKISLSTYAEWNNISNGFPAIYLTLLIYYIYQKHSTTAMVYINLPLTCLCRVIIYCFASIRDLI